MDTYVSARSRAVCSALGQRRRGEPLARTGSGGQAERVRNGDSGTMRMGMDPPEDEAGPWPQYEAQGLNQHAEKGS
jgi:hypothetical protein